MEQSGRPPIYVLKKEVKREHGRHVQLANVAAAESVSDIVRTCLGPRAMLKMLLDPQGGIVLTNDGNAVLREIDVTHPAARSIVELSKTQDEEAGDGTTSVVILAGEMLAAAEPFLERENPPTVIISAYHAALRDALEILDKQLAHPIDLSKKEEMIRVVENCLGTKFVHRWGSRLTELALEAVQMVTTEENGVRDVDLKRHVRVERIPGGEIEDCRVIRGVMINKDVLHSRMPRRIEKPRILILDSGLEYKKMENAITIESSKAEDITKILHEEESYVRKLCDDVAKWHPDLVIVEKGISDLAQHFLVKNNIAALRRLRKTDTHRIARAVGAHVVSRTDEIKESDIGTGCGLFEVRLIAEDYYAFLEECTNPKACSVLLRGASRDVLNEIGRNLEDALAVARNVMRDPRVVPGGGATEMALSHALMEKSKSMSGVEQWPYRSVATALEVIPRTLAQNCGAQVVRLMTELRAQHATPGHETWGIDGDKGVIVDMKKLQIWDTYAVKAQTIKTAIEAACILLRVDTILSGLGQKSSGGQDSAPQDETD